MIRVEDLHVKVPGFQLSSIHLESGESDVFALIGPTGSGKSLLLEAVTGLMPIARGRVFIDGREVTGFPPEKRNLGLVYQDHALFPHLSVRDNILYGARCRKLDRDVTRARFERFVERLDLGHLLDRSPVRLSGGEKQRAALARALMLQPRALLLDEPISSLDPVFRDSVRDLLRSLHRELHIPFILVSHNFSEVHYLASKGAILRKGRIEQSGSIEELFERPGTPFAAQFVGMQNLWQCTFGDGCARVGGLSLQVSRPGLKPGEFTLALRPEDIVLATGEDPDYENRFSCRIATMDCRGFYFRVLLEVGAVPFYAFWMRDVIHRNNLKPGDRVHIGFSARALHLIENK